MSEKNSTWKVVSAPKSTVPSCQSFKPIEETNAHHHSNNQRQKRSVQLFTAQLEERLPSPAAKNANYQQFPAEING